MRCTHNRIVSIFSFRKEKMAKKVLSNNDTFNILSKEKERKFISSIYLYHCNLKFSDHFLTFSPSDRYRDFNLNFHSSSAFNIAPNTFSMLRDIECSLLESREKNTVFLKTDILNRHSLTLRFRSNKKL